MKLGIKLKSIVCDIEVMVIKGSNIEVDCGGSFMLDIVSEVKVELDFVFVEGIKVGKCYVDVDVIVELLCVKVGKGLFLIGGIVLQIKDSKFLFFFD